MLTFVVGNPPAFGTLSVVTMAPLLGDRQTGPIGSSVALGPTNYAPVLCFGVRLTPSAGLPCRVSPPPPGFLRGLLVQHQAELLRGRAEVWQESRPHILDRDALSVRPYIDCRDHSARGVSHRHGHRAQA